MTPDQIRLIRSSFAHVVPISASVSQAFYDRLFAVAPAVRPMFRNDIKLQGEKLVMMLAIIVADLDRLDRLVPAAQALARRHVGYGTQPAHYAIVGDTLIWTLEAKLGPRFTPEVKDAWGAAYAVLSDVMTDAARQVAA